MKKIVRVKITLSRLTTNTELISNILFLKMQLKLATIKIWGFNMQRMNDMQIKDRKHNNSK